jgi:DNA-binding transcriptional regulator YiaG
MRCKFCKKSNLLVACDLRVIKTIAAVQYVAHLPGYKCKDCGQDFVKEVIHMDYQKRLVVAVSYGPPHGEGFRLMRRWMGLRQHEMGGLFGVRGESVCRWEGGIRRVHVSAWNLLAIIVQEHAVKGQSHTLEKLYEFRDRDPIETLDLYKNNPVQRPPPKRGRPRYVPI